MHGCCLERMKAIESGSIDAIICDPPYGTVKGAGLDGWAGVATDWDDRLDLKRVLAECDRVLRVNGALVLFCQDPYTAELMTRQHPNLPFSYRYTWEKDHFANALLSKKAPVNYTEDVCVFFKKYDTLNLHPLRGYARGLMAIAGVGTKDVSRDLGHRRFDHFSYVDSTQFGLCTEATYNEFVGFYGLTPSLSYADMERVNRKFSRRFNLPVGAKMKPNILKYKKDYTGHHPTQKPVALMADLVATYTNKGDKVLDFTMGSGSTGVAAMNLGRHFIGIERDETYYSTALGRLMGA